MWRDPKCSMILISLSPHTHFAHIHTWPIHTLGPLTHLAPYTLGTTHLADTHTWPPPHTWPPTNMTHKHTLPTHTHSTLTHTLPTQMIVPHTHTHFNQQKIREQHTDTCITHTLRPQTHLGHTNTWTTYNNNLTTLTFRPHTHTDHTPKPHLATHIHTCWPKTQTVMPDKLKPTITIGGDTLWSAIWDNFVEKLFFKLGQGHLKTYVMT